MAEEAKTLSHAARAERRQAIAKAFSIGKSVEELTTEFSVTASTVRTALLENGINSLPSQCAGDMRSTELVDKFLDWIGLYHRPNSTAARRLIKGVLKCIQAYNDDVRLTRILLGQAAARAAGKRWGGSKKGRRKVTPDCIDRISQLYMAGEPVSRIARDTGLSRPTIYGIVHELPDASVLIEARREAQEGRAAINAFLKGGQNVANFNELRLALERECHEHSNGNHNDRS